MVLLHYLFFDCWRLGYINVVAAGILRNKFIIIKLEYSHERELQY